ncbi:Vitamin B12 ABC transporter, ATPase component BtuD [Methanosarcina barkeri 227]|uniref:Vitamin B12 ABC transporter, ATPase component BtuD n=2 Tax=Methanosarcina barkeri TaxID=2208 RepID=A0A0E3LNB6_METBA|nr:Vitamin B12 ABC transporter, ATPase component BtuD [Methanosarcina barkeri MS]AKB57430.1 Vitamin B12 ABC transporter, ATPase component BtuD [Methanosarcina barkeri 227]
MVLTGVSVMFFFQALTTFTEYFAEAEAVKSAMFWMVGDIGKARWEDFRFIVPITAILVPILIWKSWDLNIIGAGDESAKSLGINVKKFRILIMVVSSLLVAGVVSFVGAIGFIGLVSPHICRLRRRQPIPDSCIWIDGSSFPDYLVFYCKDSSFACSCSRRSYHSIPRRTFLCVPYHVPEGVLLNLSIDGVTFSYASVPVRHGISMEFCEPSVVGIIGPNGARKSTLLRCINNVLKPNSGWVCLDGQKIHDMDTVAIARNFGYVPQEFPVTFQATVFDTVLMGAPILVLEG